jgi:predicted RNase H-like nuclease (RuvC/YqgF family)
MASFLPAIFGSSKIEKLKEENNKNYGHYRRVLDANEKLKNENEKLKNENEKLKNENGYLKTELKSALSNFQTVGSKCKTLTEEMAKNTKLFREAVETNKENTRLKAEIEQMKKHVAFAEDDCVERIAALKADCVERIAALKADCAKRMRDEQTACADTCAVLSRKNRLLKSELRIKAAVVVMKGAKRMRSEATAAQLLEDAA